ncbi:hypothetical protein BGZ83_011644 [Gryganskiella cystojenkinii]|nr:hypothetical protein BGZ83_011644 [Gryganskiella cystojenkinii]
MMNTAVEHIPKQLESAVAHAPANKAQPRGKFDLNRCAIVESNFQLDKAISLKNPPDAACIVTVPKGKEVETTVLLNTRLNIGSISIVMPFPVVVHTKPCSAYLHYVEAKILSGTEEHTLRKFKGYTSRFTASVEVKASASAGIFGCETSLEVTTGFSYGQEITDEKEETWKTTVAPGRYVVYQTIVMYAYRLDPSTIKIGSSHVDKANIRQNNPSIKFYDGKGAFSKYLYFFVPMYRNSPFTIPYNDDLVDDVGYDTLVHHLMENGFSKWEY